MICWCDDRSEAAQQRDPWRAAGLAALWVCCLHPLLAADREPLLAPAAAAWLSPQVDSATPELATPASSPAGGLVPLVMRQGQALRSERSVPRGAGWHQPRPSLPTHVPADPTTGVIDVQILCECAAGCDPVLFNRWLEELAAALNASPQFRVLSIDNASGAWAEGSAWQLVATVRSIDPYRPMRLDADLHLVESATRETLVRLDGVWQAPRDSVPLRPTRQGWFRRNWNPPLAIVEETALEATSPQAFLRSTAQQMAAALSSELQEIPCVTAPTPSAPAGSHPPQ